MTSRALCEMPTCHYVVVGEGADRTMLLRLAEELGVSGRLHLIGAVSNRDVPALLAASDVFWFLSKREAFGNVVVEAAASAIAIVGTRVGSLGGSSLSFLGVGFYLHGRQDFWAS